MSWDSWSRTLSAASTRRWQAWATVPGRPASPTMARRWSTGPWPSTGGTPVRAAAACTMTSMVLAPGVPGRSGVVLGEVVGDPQQPRGALGPLGVPAHPEEVVGDARGDRHPALEAHRRRPRPGRGRRPAAHAGGVVGQHPDVLGQRAAHAGDQRGGRVGVDAGEAAGHDVVPLGVGDAEGAQHQPAGRQAGRGHDRRGGHRHRLLARPRPTAGPRPRGAGRRGRRRPAPSRTVPTAPARGRPA